MFLVCILQVQTQPKLCLYFSLEGKSEGGEEEREGRGKVGERGEVEREGSTRGKEGGEGGRRRGK